MQRPLALAAPLFVAVLATASDAATRPTTPGTLLEDHTRGNAVSASPVARPTPQNLAPQAHASAFEYFQGMEARFANDGNAETRWSGIPGHNVGGWYELDWDRPVRVGELVIFQHDRYVKEMDVQVWDDVNQVWITLEHLGHPDQRLPKTVVCQCQPRSTTRLRLANITNGPSFTEVEVFEEAFAHPPAVNLASDAEGHFLGMVSDPWGGAPVPGAEVRLSGRAKTGPWDAAAHSDAHGLFVVPMPLGLVGQLNLTVRPAGSQETPITQPPVDAAGFQYGLSPDNERCRMVRLDGAWRFLADPPAGFWDPAFDDHAWTPILVPGHFEMQGFRSRDGVGGYRRTFQTPAGEGRWKLRFDGVYSGAEVWVNGQRVAYHEGGALPFEADITDVVHNRDNLLAVRVTEHTVVSDRLDKMSEYADFPLAGIMRPVRLFRVPPVHIGALALATVFDAEYRDAELAVRIAVLHESKDPLPPGTLEFRLTDPDRRAVPLQAKALPVRPGPWQRAEVNTRLTVPNPRHWDAEHPNLYTLETLLRTRDRVLDRVVQKIGFRQTEIRGTQLLVNGQPVKIRGTCHHDSHPVLGRAVTAELARQDLELMKEANLNALRTSHYPPLPALLNVADELGLYVEDEGSFCWVEPAAADDLRLTPRLMQLNAELVARDRNHPSVLLWSLCNESAFGYGFERSLEWMRAADPSRPHAGSYDRGSLELLARHNPIALAEISQLEKVDKPVLWDEAWCVFQGIFGDVAELWLDPGLRDYYAEPLRPVYERMMRTRNIAGTQIWAWSDDIFCVPHRGLEYGRGTTRSHFIENEYRLPDRGLVGDAPWGVVDGWRRRKPEFWITKKLHSPVKLAEGPIALPAHGEPIRLPVENQYDFTDLAALRVDWQTGAERGRARAAAPPHHTGVIEIRPTRPLAEGQVLSLEIRDPPGRLVDAYRFPLGRSIVELPRLPGPAPGTLRLVQETSLAGAGTRVVGTDFELLFDAATGGLRRGVGFGQALLLELPRLHLLPAAAPLRSLPDPSTWNLSHLDLEQVGQEVRARVTGTYDHFEGGYDLVITPEGVLTVHAAFTYTGDKVSVREAGLAFSVPLDCDCLRWQRRAEWSVYPADHIGRPSGETRSFVPHAGTLPPTWPWAADNSPMGCNDFRSTKRHIDWASISYPHGPGIQVESDGSQHARAEVQPDRISLHINDWYGGTHSGLWEWTSNYGEGRTIAPGDRIESAVRLRLARMPEAR